MKNGIIITLALISLISCNFDREPAPYPYDSTINDKRREVGLRLIDSTFRSTLGRSTYGRVNKRYGSPRLKLKRNIRGDTLKSPVYWLKHVHLDKKTGEVMAEDDIFRSGKYKTGIDLTYFEELTYRYVFKDFENYNTLKTFKKKFSKGWYYIYRFPKSFTEDSKYHKKFYKDETKLLTEIEMDSILKSWNLKRLNY